MAYNPKSMKAEEFIDHSEILDTLKFADENKDNKELLKEIVEHLSELALTRLVHTVDVLAMRSVFHNTVIARITEMLHSGKNEHRLLIAVLHIVIRN